MMNQSIIDKLRETLVGKPWDELSEGELRKQLAKRLQVTLEKVLDDCVKHAEQHGIDTVEDFWDEYKHSIPDETLDKILNYWLDMEQLER